jgi:hypothetical protein
MMETQPVSEMSYFKKLTMDNVQKIITTIMKNAGISTTQKSYPAHHVKFINLEWLPSPQLKTLPSSVSASVWPSLPFDEDTFLTVPSMITRLGCGWLLESPSPRRP